MLKVKLFFTRREGPDDILQVYDDETYFEMANVVYTPGDHSKKSNSFYTSRGSVLDYISTIFKSMETDADPFEFVQIQTAIHPSVMVSVADVSDRQTRYRLEDMVEQALYANVEAIKLKRNVRTPVEGH
jgi:hypothetical protein